MAAPKAMTDDEVATQHPDNITPNFRVLQHKGHFYPAPTRIPHTHDREKVWEALFPGAKAGPEPFMLRIPADVDFWTFVWGQNGKDFDQIQKCFLDDRVSIAWAYAQPVMGEQKTFNGKLTPEMLPEIDIFLAVSYNKARRWSGGSSFDPNHPENLARVGDLWTKVKGWYSDFANGRIDTLLGYLDAKREADKAMAIAKPPLLMPGMRPFQDKVALVKAEREACEKIVLEIIVKHKDSKPADLHRDLTGWAMTCKESPNLDAEQRVNLASLVWRNLTTSASARMDITIWATTTLAMLKERPAN